MLHGVDDLYGPLATVTFCGTVDESVPPCGGGRLTCKGLDGQKDTCCPHASDCANAPSGEVICRSRP